MLTILTGPDNVILRKKSVPVTKINKDLLRFIDKMLTTMEKTRGVGLAASQVGKNIRVIVLKVFHKDGKRYTLTEMINPVITYQGSEKNVDIEGCLSIPGQYGKVERFSSLQVFYLNKKSVQIKLDLQGMNARIVQHEVDHLDGVLFIDKALEMVTPEKEEDVKI